MFLIRIRSSFYLLFLNVIVPTNSKNFLATLNTLQDATFISHQQSPNIDDDLFQKS